MHEACPKRDLRYTPFKSAQNNRWVECIVLNASSSYRSLKNYTAELYEKALRDIDFPNYEKFSDVNIAYSDLIEKITETVNKIAPMKQSRIKSNSQDWFDGEVAEKIAIREKLFKIFKKSQLQIDKELYNKA